MTIAQLTLKGVKTFKGMEGHGFNATLYCNNKKAALLIDSARGGPLGIQWANAEMKKAVLDIVAVQPPQKVSDDAEAWERSLYDAQGYRPLDAEHIFNGMVDTYLQKRDMDRILKTHVCFSKPGDAAGTFWKVKHKGNVAGAKQFVISKHGANVTFL